MPSNSPSLSKEAIVTLFQSRALLKKIDYHWAEDDELLTLCSCLHNSRIIDILEIVRWPEFAELTPHDFFTVQNFLVVLMPRLNADALPMLEFVAALVAKAGTDLMANRPNGALIEWLKARPDEAEEIILQAAAGDTASKANLVFALQALGNPARARAIVAVGDVDQRLSAILALGRIPHIKTDIPETIATFRKALSEDRSDVVNGNIVFAVANILAVTNEAPAPDALELVADALVDPGQATIYAAAQSLWVAKPILTRELVESLLCALLDVDPQHRGSIEVIDAALFTVISRGFAQEAVDYVRDLGIKYQDDALLNEFKSFFSALFSGEPHLLSHTVANWLLSGSIALCKTLDHQFMIHDSRNAALTVDFSTFKREETYFVCRKALGYFFLSPIIAASILLSAARQSDQKLVAAVTDLLFDPLLINYGGDLRTFLTEIPESDAAYGAAKKALENAESYVEGLSSVGLIKELAPSEFQRQIDRIERAIKMRASMKEAQKHSVFANLVTRSVILHGNRSVSFVKDLNGDRRSIEMDLKPHGVSFELPRMEVTDPVGLSMMLIRFRAETISQ